MHVKNDSYKRIFTVLLLATLIIAPLVALSECDFSEVSVIDAPLGMFPPRDESVLYILRKLGLPTSWDAEEANNNDAYLESLISDEYAVPERYSAPYTVIIESSLEIVDAWIFESMIGELFAGKGGGYLAILRKEDSVICAEYVNGYVPEAITDDFIMLPSDCFQHTLTYVKTNMYWAKTETSYFIDGTACETIYDSPDDHSGEMYLVNTFSKICPNILATRNSSEVYG